MYQLTANGSTARGISHIFGKPVPVWHYAGTVWRIGLPLAGRIVDTKGNRDDFTRREFYHFRRPRQDGKTGPYRPRTQSY